MIRSKSTDHDDIQRMLWSIHPQPQEGESMESWVIRQAHANESPTNVFVSTHLRPHDADLDFLEHESYGFRLAERCISNGTCSAQEMTLFAFKHLLGSEKKDLLLWITKATSPRRFCPLCFSEDETPHLRLIWRLSFAPVCVKHKVLLRSKCDNVACEAAYEPWLIDPSYDLGRCYRCGSILSDASTDTIGPTEPAYAAVSYLLDLLKGNETLGRINWNCSAAELFHTINFLVKFLGVMQMVETSSVVDFDPLKNMIHLLGKAWPHLQNWPASMQRLISENEQELNDLANKVGLFEEGYSPVQTVLGSMKPYVTDDMKERIRQLKQDGCSIREISRMLKIPKSTVHHYQRRCVLSSNSELQTLWGI